VFYQWAFEALLADIDDFAGHAAVFAWAVLITQSYCSACELRAAYSGHAGRFGRCAGPRGPHPQYVDPPNDRHHWRIIATASVDRHCAQPRN